MKIIPPSTAFDDAIYILEPWPNYLSGKPHTGIDIYCQQYRGHKVRSTEIGKIVEIIKGNKYDVSRVIVEGDATGSDVIFKHTLATKKKGDKVEAGEVFGYLDDSGKAAGWWAGYHLHFQIGFDDRALDPVKYLLGLMPEVTWFMRDKVLDIYRTRDYFDMMKLGEKPF